jgi:cobalt transporter subunit CbtA
MTMKMLTSALFAGLLAGLITVVLQYFLMEPLILEAEEYESGAKIHAPFATGLQTASETATDHTHGVDDTHTTRFGLAFAADFIVSVAWGLIMVAGFAMAGKLGHHVTPQQGLLWGIAGFVAVHVAPGIGLAPELPGIPAADLHARQIWWVMTVSAAVIALALAAYGQTPVAYAGAVVLLVAPHIIGAPMLDQLSGTAPPELAGEYVARSYAVALASWTSLGVLAAGFWNRGTGTAA